METLPIFPLNTVLFPGMPLLLHIFEQRYRCMLDRCLEEDLPVGIFLIKEGMEALADVAEPYSVGTRAIIRAVHRQPDGRSHVELVGERRIRLLTTTRHDDGYAMGQCQTLEDDTSTLPADEQQMLFESGLRSLLQLQGTIPLDPVLLCHSAIRLLDLPLPEKQSLLEENSFIKRWNRTSALIRDKLAYQKLASRLLDSEGPQGMSVESLN